MTIDEGPKRACGSSANCPILPPESSLHADVRPRLKSLLAVATLALTAAPALAEPIYGITDATTSSLVLFDSTTPALLSTVGVITGVVAGQTLRAIDFRPSDGQLYAVSSSGTAAQLYMVNLATGAATVLGAGFALAGNSSTRVSIDFNPVANGLRVVTGSGQSYRVNANTGALIAQDTSVSPSLLLADVSFTNSVVGAASTTLYAYDFSTDNIGTICSVGGTPVSPNSGHPAVAEPLFDRLAGVGPPAEAIRHDDAGPIGLPRRLHDVLDQLARTDLALTQPVFTDPLARKRDDTGRGLDDRVDHAGHRPVGGANRTVRERGVGVLESPGPADDEREVLAERRMTGESPFGDGADLVPRLDPDVRERAAQRVVLAVQAF